jgi:hypothetical protein
LSPPGGTSARRRLLLAAGLLSAAAIVSAQSASVRVEAETMRVRTSGLRFIHGPALQRLKDGRSVVFALTLAVLRARGGPVAAEGHARCGVSYDLWDERFAGRVGGPPPLSAAHLSAAQAEAWCLDRLAVPVREMGLASQDAPFWIRLAYKVEDGDGGTRDNGASAIMRLIDMLSGRGLARALEGSQEAGPFRLPG